MIPPPEEKLSPDVCRRCCGTGKRHPDEAKGNGCHDCGEHFAFYMVHNWVWREAWPTYAAERQALMKKYKYTSEYFRVHLDLCFSCLEKRLGRKLKPEDFDLDLPVNRGIALGMRIAT